MKMLTGLLDATSGSRPAVRQGDHTRRHDDADARGLHVASVLSLYELTVRRDLALHARLYRVPRAGRGTAGGTGNSGVRAGRPCRCAASSLPLGIRQSFSNAACLHRPEVLILDEPTSGVDPAARDMFWRHLIRLSREEGSHLVSTHS
jgi:ribosome-dependent ATPase